MWIKFNFKTEDSYGNPTTVKFAIEVEKTENALIVNNYLGNNAKVTDTKVMLNQQADTSTIYINKEGHTVCNSDHLVTNADIQSFIWTIRAGISMGKALAGK